ncbi:hypothetical protein KC717_00215 [Candidatus Dojkabacteria bacterium]|uniref:EF-hand domain-containing protein n=1 Tax=Candidatus Dojkabacteria bacterium TaxID=2099670 RepID=A0A955L7D5_9BACT|nr:hypothetical protein [Candidatus Dojkabacteria bacterium]
MKLIDRTTILVYFLVLLGIAAVMNPLQAQEMQDLELTDVHSSSIPSSTVETVEVILYAQAKNNSDRDIYGYVQFQLNESDYGEKQPISVLSGQTDSVFFKTLLPPGNQIISAYILSEDSQIEFDKEVVKEIFVDRDYDGDKVGNQEDPDDDNDGLLDADEIYQGTDQFNPDSDGDGIPDGKDSYPLRIGEPTVLSDNDAILSEEEVVINNEVPEEHEDQITGNSTPIDSDNDGLSDEDEIRFKTNVEKVDTDNDGLSDGEEVHEYSPDPLSPDSDNDGYMDAEEVELGTDPREFEWFKNIITYQRWILLIIAGLIFVPIGILLLVLKEKQSHDEETDKLLRTHSRKKSVTVLSREKH